MKTKLHTIIFGLLAALMLVACNNGKDEPNMPPPDLPNGQRLVKSVVEADKDEVWKNDFYYTEGRISRIESSYTGEYGHEDEAYFSTTHYTFEGNKIRIDTDGDISTATLNDQGYVSSVAQNKGRTTNFTYSDKHMTSQGVADLWSANYTWNAGNIVSSQMKFVGNQSSTIYTYSDIANNPACNIDLNFSTPISEELNIEYGLAGLGYCGLRSEKLISSISIKDGDRVDITYTLDKKGFVTKIGYKYSDENFPRTVEIEYY